MLRRKLLQEAGPGILFGSTKRLRDLKLCLLSDCNSWVLKTEKVLIHGSFLFGFVSPSHTVWEMIKYLISLSSTKIVNFMNEYVMESNIKMVMSLLEQIGLEYVWDGVRDGSLCMRFNNCENDFLAQLSNIKMKMCGVDNWMDDKREISTCEMVFNDSPLILLALGMLLLTILANSPKKGNAPANGPQPANLTNSSSPPDAPNSPDAPKSHNVFKSSNVPNPPNNTDTHTPSNVSKGPFLIPVSSTSSEQATSNSEAPVLGFVSPTFGAPIQRANKPATNCTPKPNPPGQNINAECPNCKKKSIMRVPKPWTLCCEQVLPSAKKNACTAAKKKELTEKVINEVFKGIKCEYCKEQLMKKLEEIKHKKKKDAKSPKKKDTKSTKKTNRKKCK